MWERTDVRTFQGLFTTKVVESHVKLHVTSDAQTELRPVSLFGYICLLEDIRVSLIANRKSVKTLKAEDVPCNRI